jgi:hypothetical protein
VSITPEPKKRRRTDDELDPDYDPRTDEAQSARSPNQDTQLLHHEVQAYSKWLFGLYDEVTAKINASLSPQQIPLVPR